MSSKLVAQIAINIQEICRIVEQLKPLILKGTTADLDVIEASAVAAMSPGMSIKRSPGPERGIAISSSR